MTSRAFVLSPCLLQLTVYYTFALAGMSMQQRSLDSPGTRRQVIKTAMFFIRGFTIVFTAAGTLTSRTFRSLKNA